MSAHTKEDKIRILDRLLPPYNRKIADLAREEGVSVATIYLWRKEFGYDDKLRAAKMMANNNDQDQAEAWLSSEDKFLIVVETANMMPEEFIQYCRENELNPNHVTEWRLNCIRANETSPTQLYLERQQTRQLKRENQMLRRKLKNQNQS